MNKQLQFCTKTLLAAVLLTGAVGCAESTIDEEDAQRYATDWTDSVEEHLESKAVLAAGSEAIESRLAQAVEEEQRQRPDQTPFDQLVAEVYAERDYEPGLVGDEELTPAGEAVWSALQEVEDHHLDPEPYRRDDIEEAKQQWKELQGTVDGFDDLQATDADAEEAVAWLVEQPEEEFDLVAQNYDALTDALVEDERFGTRLTEAVEAYQDKRGAIAEAAAEFEYLLVRGLARYAHEQRYFRIKDIFVHPRHWDYYSDPDVERSGTRPDPQRGAFRGGQVWRKAANLAEEMTEENKLEILDDRLQAAIAEVLDADDPHGRVAAIPPQQPQYTGLVAEYQRYRDIVDDGGWDEVERNNHIRPGQTHETIGELKRRLRAEGYFPDDVDIDDTWDETLTEAIEEYQETHQMNVDGRPNHVFWYSLNISAERRMEQIGLNMDRWRHTNIDHDRSRYAFVNIPDFTIELWEEQERVMRFATVVGDNDKSINPLTNEAEHSNRTPTPLGAYIDRVAFNPYWNVPNRLRAQNILPDVQASIERKYVLKLHHMEQLAQEGADEIDDSEVTLASIRSSITLTDEHVAENPDEADEEEALDEEEASDDEEPDVALGNLPGVGDEELAARLEEEEDDNAPSIDDLTDEERQELKDELMAEKTQRAMSTWTYMDNVYNEEQERYENKRFFDGSRLQRLEASLYGGEADKFRAHFPYIDWEHNMVDVESTDPNHIPSWYAANDYEVVHPGHERWEYVREVPNPGNALGLVKIIFPNYDNIYLHDTPEKGLFRSAVRGFSHGCIRLEKPLELSRKLLKLDGQDDIDVDRILRNEEYHPVFLNRHVPIFLEYYTVRVDDEGRANFLSDVYGYDREVWDGAEKDPALHQEVNIHPDDRPDPDD